MDKDAPKIAIIGAGVIGMTVADILQKQLKANITIIADQFKEDTVSSIAAGIFRPGLDFRGPTKEITKKWVNDSWYHWHDILMTSEAADAGVMAVSTYIFSTQANRITRNHLIEDLVPIYRPVKDNELSICGGEFKYGSYFSTVKVGCEKYLPWIEKKYLDNGGKIVKDKIDTFSSLSGKYDLVFNCTGMGAKYLCNDDYLVPIRGQIIKVRAPWIKMAYYGDYDTYIIPGMDGIATLGGVRQYDSYNLKICKHDAASIMERCCQMLPALKNVEIVGHKVGFRPHRAPVRVEPELINNVKVVHCYGHGGYGVTSAPGTALHAVQIGMDLMTSNIRNKL